MKSFKEALADGFTSHWIADWGGDKPMWSFKFGDGNEYELTFEPLLFDDQWYVALYRKQILLTEKVVVKPGK